MKKKPLTEKEARALGKQFAEELQTEFEAPLRWWFIGSLKDGRYRPGESDIDMIIIPKEAGMFGKEAIERVLEKMEQYKSYGTVFKKGREISLIDVMIFFDMDAVNRMRKMDKGVQTVYERELPNLEKNLYYSNKKILRKRIMPLEKLYNLSQFNLFEKHNQEDEKEESRKQIKKLKEDIENGDIMPAIAVTKFPQYYAMADGQHRVIALYESDVKSYFTIILSTDDRQS